MSTFMAEYLLGNNFGVLSPQVETFVNTSAMYILPLLTTLVTFGFASAQNATAPSNGTSNPCSVKDTATLYAAILHT